MTAAQAELDRVWAWVFEGEITRVEPERTVREAGTVELELLALDGEPAPGTEATFQNLLSASLLFNARGEIALTAQAVGQRSHGHWVGEPGRLRFLGWQAEVDLETDSGPLKARMVSLVGLDEAGRVIVQTQVPNVLGWIDDRRFHPIAAWKARDPEAFDAPLKFESNQRSSSVQVAGGRALLSVGGALYFGSLKGPRKVVEVGMHAPGTPTEKVVFKQVGSAQLSSDGRHVLFQAGLSGPGVTGGGYWIAGPDGVNLVTRTEGNTPDGQAFRGVTAALGAQGNVLLSYSVAGAPTWQHWYGRPGELRQLTAPEGNMWAPRIRGDSVVFLDRRTGNLAVLENGVPRNIELSQQLSQLQYSPDGAVLGRTAIDERNEFAYWVGRPGALELVVRSGDSVQVKPGDVRKIAAGGIRFAKVAGSNDTPPLNDRGQALMVLGFEAVEGLRDVTYGIFRVGAGGGEIQGITPVAELEPAPASAPQSAAESGAGPVPDSVAGTDAAPSSPAASATGSTAPEPAASSGTAVEAGTLLPGAAGPLGASFDGLRGRSYVIKFPKGVKFEATLNHKRGRCSVMDRDFKDYGGTWRVDGTELTMSFASAVFPLKATVRDGRHEYSGAVAVDGTAVVWSLGGAKITLRELE